MIELGLCQGVEIGKVTCYSPWFSKALPGDLNGQVDPLSAKTAFREKEEETSLIKNLKVLSGIHHMLMKPFLRQNRFQGSRTSFHLQVLQLHPNRRNQERCLKPG